MRARAGEIEGTRSPNMGTPCRAATVRGVRCEARPGLTSRAGRLRLARPQRIVRRDLPTGLPAFMTDAQVPWSVGALGGAVTDPAWRAKPSWYLVAAEDRMIPPPAQPAPFWTVNTSGKRLLAPANQEAGRGCT